MVYLIGVNHSCQYESPIDRRIVREERLVFQDHVLKITHKYNISLLAEEFSEEAKTKARVSESMLEKLGKTEGIEQRFCDPTSIEKKENGIADNDDDRREQFWLSRIQDYKNKNMLFVCGYTHVESFRKKLITADFDVEHESKHWFNFSTRELWDSDP